jgi:hypothetical protein
LIGLEREDIAVDDCITKATGGGEVAGRSPVDRGKSARKCSIFVDAHGIPLGVVAAPANRHDSPLLEPTLDTLDGLGQLPERVTVHLDRGYDAGITRERLAAREMQGEIAAKGKPAPVAASQRWPVERINSWMNAYKKLVRCTERRRVVIDVWLTFAVVIVIVGRLIREAWTRDRWDTRPARTPSSPLYWR